MGNLELFSKSDAKNLFWVQAQDAGVSVKTLRIRILRVLAEFAKGKMLRKALLDNKVELSALVLFLRSFVFIQNAASDVSVDQVGNRRKNFVTYSLKQEQLNFFAQVSGSSWIGRKEFNIDYTDKLGELIGFNLREKKEVLDSIIYRSGPVKSDFSHHNYSWLFSFLSDGSDSGHQNNIDDWMYRGGPARDDSWLEFMYSQLWLTLEHDIQDAINEVNGIKEEWPD